MDELVTEVERERRGSDIDPAYRADRDINEAAQLVAALPQSIAEQFFIMSLDLLSVAGFDGRFKRLNPAWETLLGYPVEWMLGQRLMEFVHPDDKESVQAATDRLTGDLGDVVACENRYRARDGSYRWLLWSIASDAQQELMFAVAKDITERKRTDAATEVETQHLAAVAHSVEDAIITKDRDAIITSWNRGAERLYGYTAAETVGQPVAMLIPEEHRGEDREILDRVLAGEPGQHLETVRVCKDGSQLRVSLAASGILDAQGRVVEVATIARDITAVHAANRELKAANNELEAFSYSVSHDLRAPLRTVSGFGAILESTYGADMPEEAQRYLRLMQKGAHDMGELVDDLLVFSRLGRQALSRQLVQPGDVARRALEELGASGGEPQALVSFAPMPACHADPTLLRQVFQNLLSNALKFTRGRAEAKIEVGFGPREHDGELEVGAYHVRDNGVGFDTRYADNLFGVFQRLHRAEDYEGTGVGLAIVERIVSRHGGEVWAESVLGEGATFYFSLGDEPG